VAFSLSLFPIARILRIMSVLRFYPMIVGFNEDARVKIPAIITLIRLGYFSLKNRLAPLLSSRTKDLQGGYSFSDIDKKANILTGIFYTALKKLNLSVDENALKKYFNYIQTYLDNYKLGKEFYRLLSVNLRIKFVDFNNLSRNIFNMVTYLLYGKEGDGKNQNPLLFPENEVKTINDFSIVLDYDKIMTKNYSLSAGQYFDAKIKYEKITTKIFKKKIVAHKDNLAKFFKHGTIGERCYG
jgi:hypothetical protein